MSCCFNVNEQSEIIEKYKTDIYLYFKFKNSKNNNFSKDNKFYAINKSWLEDWKKIVDYNSNEYTLLNCANGSTNVRNKIKICKRYHNLNEINNKDIIIDINSFLNDGQEKNKENIILKDDSYEIINEEVWNSFKKYKYDIEINSDIINNTEEYFLVNLLFKNQEMLEIETCIYVKNKSMPDLIKKIINCLNLNNNFISKKINSFYNTKKYYKESFYYSELNENERGEYELSLCKKNLCNQSNSNDYIYLVGLKNLGATCFLNAVLQILNNIKDFSDYICDIYFNYKTCPISSALKDVFINLRKYSIEAYNPYKFIDTISKFNTKFIKNKPNDSWLFLQFILNSVHKELNKNKDKKYSIEEDDLIDEADWEKIFYYEKKSFECENNSIITELFYGIQATETYCYNCQKINYVFEHFNILDLPILQNYNINISDLLIDYSREIELDDKNKNYCIYCKHDYKAKYSIQFYEMPQILIIHPERKNKGYKYDINIDFKEDINIQLSEKKDKKIIAYNLIGIIYHCETIDKEKHNIAICKIEDCWHIFNDNEIIKNFDIKELDRKGLLLLIYKKIFK